MSKRYCGSYTTMGHGSNAVCGQRWWDETYQCDKCNVKDLQAEVAELKRQLAEILHVPREAL